MIDADYMRLAIRKAEEAITAGQSPFGAVLIKDSVVIAAAHNTVWRDLDPTAHAEVNCVRKAAAALRTIALHGCTIYSTTEPCPMCLAALHWAKIDRVVYGASIADATKAGFGELSVAARTLAELGKSPLRVEGGLLGAECAALFDQWRAAGLSAPY
jgi:guanine deaminase